MIIVQYSVTSTETIRLIRTDSPGRPLTSTLTDTPQRTTWLMNPDCGKTSCYRYTWLRWKVVNSEEDSVLASTCRYWVSSSLWTLTFFDSQVRVLASALNRTASVSAFFLSLCVFSHWSLWNFYSVLIRLFFFSFCCYVLFARHVYLVIVWVGLLPCVSVCVSACRAGVRACAMVCVCARARTCVSQCVCNCAFLWVVCVCVLCAACGKRRVNTIVISHFKPKA